MRSTALLLFCSFLTLLSGCAPSPTTSASGRTSIRPFEQQLKIQKNQLNNLDRVVQQLSTTVSATQNELITLRAEIVALKKRDTTVAAKQNQERTIVPAENQIAATQQSATDIYLNAFSAYTGGSYTTAIEGFNKFLHYYPRNPYVPNAHFWKGEAFLAQGALQDAAEAFNAVATDYPDAHKAPDALLKLARIYLTLNQRSQARASLLTLQQHYPNSTISKKIPKDLLEVID